MTILTALLYLSLFPSTVVAEQVDCEFLQIEEMEGEVNIKDSSSAAVPANVKDVLAAGDSIHTGNDSWADLRFCDGGAIRLSENSDFEFLGPDDEESDWVLWSFSLLKGGVRALIQGDGDSVKFRLKTPTAALGVRGTEFYVDVDEDGSHLYTTEGSVLWGDSEGWNQLNSRSDKWKGRFQEVKKNFFSSVKRGERRPKLAKRFESKQLEGPRFRFLKNRNLERTKGFRFPRMGKRNAPIFQKNRPILQKRMLEKRKEPVRRERLEKRKVRKNSN